MRIKIGFALVLLMALLQSFYAIYAFVDPSGFSVVRGTELASIADSDWVRIYASRTLFIALVVAVLLYLKNYKALVIVALFGTVMPVTDVWLAYASGAATGVLIKHIVTAIYLLATAAILFSATRQQKS